MLLDASGDRPRALQSQQLRVLQEKEVEAVGSNRLERVDVRVIAATTRNLDAMVADGRFRADLFYRLNVLPIRVPPLRERLADLEALAEALLDDIARRSGLPARSLTPQALELLARQTWPGNIRELRNVLEQAALMTDDLSLEPQHFKSLDGEAAGAAAAPAVRLGLLRPLAEQVAELERAAIAAALAQVRGNRVAAARLLGMSRAALYDRLARYPELDR